MSDLNTINNIKKKQLENQRKSTLLDSSIKQYSQSDAAMNSKGIELNSPTIQNNAAIANKRNQEQQDFQSLVDQFISDQGIPNTEQVMKRTRAVTGNELATKNKSTKEASGSTQKESSLLDTGISAATSVGSTVKNLWSSAKGTATEFYDTVADKASGAASWAMGLADKAGNSLSGYASSALAWSTNMANKASEWATDATNWFNGVTASFSGGNSNTEVKAGHTASDNKQGIKNASLPAADTGFDFSKLTSGTGFAKFKELAGSAKNLFTAVGNAKKKIVGMVQSASNTAATLIKTAQKTVNKFINPITKAVNTARVLTNPNNVQALVTNSLNFLPFGLNKMIGKMAYNEAAKISTKIGKVQTRLHGISTVGDKVAGLLQYSQGSSEVTNDLGKIIMGLCSGSVGADDLKLLYKNALEVCPNVETPSFIDCGTNKLMYSTLMKQAMDYGSAHLISQLANCQSYFGTDTKKLMLDTFFDTAKAGDPTVVNAVIQGAGTGNITNAKDIALALGTNLREEASDLQLSAAYREAYKEALTSLGLTTQMVLSDGSQISYNKNTVVDASSVALLSRRPALLSALDVSDDTRNTVLNVYNTYMQKETTSNVTVTPLTS
jgi:hypothetical protein